MPAVGAVVFKAGKVLLVQRGHPPAQGQWAIPGGNVQIGETLQQAAEREILEETGVVIQAKEPCYTFDAIVRDHQGRVQYHYIIVDLFAKYISGTPCPGDDAVDARWIAQDELTHLNISPPTLELLQQWDRLNR